MSKKQNISRELATRTVLELLGRSGVDVRIASDKEAKEVLEGKNRVRKMTAWHGSGMSFDKFDTEFIGEGQGLQTHGWGIYLTVNEELAKEYASVGFSNKDYHLQSRIEYQRGRLELEEDLLSKAEKERKCLLPDFKELFWQDASVTDHILRNSYGDNYTKVLGIDKYKPWKDQIDDSMVEKTYPLYKEYLDGYIEKKKQTIKDIEGILDDTEKQINNSGKFLYSVSIPRQQLDNKDKHYKRVYLNGDGVRFLQESNAQLLDMGMNPIKGFDSNIKVGDVYDALRNIFPTTDEVRDFMYSIGYDAIFLPHQFNYLEEAGFVDNSERRRFTERLYTENIGKVSEEPYNGDERMLRDRIDALFEGQPYLSNKDLYERLSSFLGGDKKTSEFLYRCGYKGVHYRGGLDGECFVMFNGDDIKINGRIRLMQTSDAKLYGWQNGNQVYLTRDGINPETPIHEYTHLWAQAMMVKNPVGWESVKSLLRDTPAWDEVLKDSNYDNIRTDENEIASETLSRLSGVTNAAELEKWIEGNCQDVSKEGLKDKNVIDRVIDGLKKFWSWVGKELFEIKEFKDIKDVTDRVMYDLVHGTDVTLTKEDIQKTIDSQCKEIIDKSKKDGTYLKAPNGKQSNLNEYGWAIVRTPLFKNWFGDWEKQYRLEKLRHSKPIFISGDEVPRSENLKEYRKNALDYGRKLKGVYVNKDTGLPIFIGPHGLKEVLEHDYKTDIHLQSVAAIPQIIENGIYIDSVKNEDSEKNNNVREYQYLICGLKVKEADYTVKAVIALDKDGNRYYDHKLTQIEKGNLLDEIASLDIPISSALSSASPRGDTGGVMPGEQESGKLNSPLSNYKDIRLFLILQTFSSKILDKNGEPLICYHGTPLSRDDVKRTQSGTGWKYYKDGHSEYIPPRAPFHTFRPGNYGGLIFFGKDYDTAHAVATERAQHIPDDANGNEQWTTEDYVFDCFLNCKNPFNARTDGEKVLSNLKDEDLEAYDFYLGGTNPVSRDSAKKILRSDNSWMVVETPAFQAEIRRMGYDGIIASDQGEEYVAVLNPGQIKSASENIGLFSSLTDDIRYQIIGEKGAKSLDRESGISIISNLETARAMEIDGIDGKSIRLATGWERGSEGKWRYEIPDMQNFSITGALRGKKEGEEKTLPDYIDFPELFKAYPWIKNVPVHISDLKERQVAGMKTEHDVFSGEIIGQVMTISGEQMKKLKAYPERLKGVFIHEIQHAIQNYEGFAEGGDDISIRNALEGYIDRHAGRNEGTREMLKEYGFVRSLEEGLKTNKTQKSVVNHSDDVTDREFWRYWNAMDEINNPSRDYGVENDYEKVFGENFDLREPVRAGYHVDEAIEAFHTAAEHYYGEISEVDRNLLNICDSIDNRLHSKEPDEKVSDYELYMSLSGEVEARNVQRRANLTEEQRRSTMLYDTEDRPRNKQLAIHTDNFGYISKVHIPHLPGRWHNSDGLKEKDTNKISGKQDSYSFIHESRPEKAAFDLDNSRKTAPHRGIRL